MAIRLIAPPVAMAVSMADARASARANGTDQDAEIEIRVRALTAEAEHITGRSIINRTYVVTAPGFAGLIPLPSSPLVEVVSLKYLDVDGATQTLSENAYVINREIEPGFVALAAGASWPATKTHPEAVILTVICGYGPDETTTPVAFKGFILAKVREYFAPAGTPESPHLIRGLDCLKVHS
ncbi:head-tail connector protein [Massilia pseudoviolaceinigra]|uniref:head-tail connector protein n=1 Tax=Massilia pseudoviolaceinigra TaxID=3057165 RepID=UPI0027968904|nr:hypothetical protein [Massilia sp. CCM 9206]MDQ1925174.1 hypothetical protein [Massilia sp. CCM 9206]